MQEDKKGTDPEQTVEKDNAAETPLTEERDADELVHAPENAEVIPSETEEQDADDLVHRTKTESPAEFGKEQDPDDLVHGK